MREGADLMTLGGFSVKFVGCTRRLNIIVEFGIRSPLHWAQLAVPKGKVTQGIHITSEGIIFK